MHTGWLKTASLQPGKGQQVNTYVTRRLPIYPRYVSTICVETFLIYLAPQLIVLESTKFCSRVTEPCVNILAEMFQTWGRYGMDSPPRVSSLTSFRWSSEPRCRPSVWWLPSSRQSLPLGALGPWSCGTVVALYRCWLWNRCLWIALSRVKLHYCSKILWYC